MVHALKGPAGHILGWVTVWGYVSEVLAGHPQVWVTTCTEHGWEGKVLHTNASLVFRFIDTVIHGLV